MIRHYRLAEGRVMEDGGQAPAVLVVLNPDENEKRMLLEEFNLDEHTLLSALDPDEPSRLEFEPDHLALIFKRPRNISMLEQLSFRTSSVGLFRFAQRMVLILNEDFDPFAGKMFARVNTLNDLILKLLYGAVFHFLGHLRGINMITEELEQKLNKSVSNQHLAHFFSLGKSLVYYLNSINSNSGLLEKLKINAAKIGFSPEELELLDDLAIENHQCYRQAEIHSNVLSTLMDARASIVGNNLNALVKTLNIITIGIMLPTLVVSIFSMNVDLPLGKDHPLSFWAIIALAVVSVIGVMAWWRYRKT